MHNYSLASQFEIHCPTLFPIVSLLPCVADKRQRMPSDYDIDTDMLLQNMVIAVGISKGSDSIDNREINFVKAKLLF